MKQRANRKWAGVSLVLLLLVIGVPVWQTYRMIRQGQRDHALIAAIKRNDTPAVLTLLAQGADPNARDLPPDTRSFWQMLTAMLRGRQADTGFAVSALPLALDTNIDPEYGGDWGIPPKDKVLIQALIERGAAVNVPNEGGLTPLILATRANRRDMVELLLAHHADIEGKDSEGQTALFRAARYGFVDIAESLRNRGANVNAQTTHGDTALKWTAMEEDNKCLPVLLAWHADVNLQDKEGFTALMEAADRGFTRTVKRLLQQGAHINAQNREGTTALMLAAEAKDSETVHLLLARGADVRLKDRHGNTALTLVQRDRAHCQEDREAQFELGEIIQILKKAGAEKVTESSVGMAPPRRGMQGTLWI